MKKYKIIIDFFKVIGAQQESRRYLKLFQKGNPVRFAMIRIGGGVIRETKDLVAMDLAYLWNLNLYPIVIHGGGPQIDEALTHARIKFEKVDGLRVTTRKQIPIIHRVLNQVNAELVNEIQKLGGQAVGLTEDIFIAQKHPDERLGYAGEVKRVNLASILRAVKSKKIPVVSCLGFDEEGNIYNVNADTAARAAVKAIKPKKYILITEEGGIRNAHSKIIPYLNLTEELEALVQKNVVTGGMLLKVREIQNLLQEVNYNLPVQITSAGRLLKELFTDKGSGTFIKLGAHIVEHKGYEGIDKARLKKLIEYGFNKPLKEDYFEKPVDWILLDEQYRGVAIVRKVEEMCYLDKFCVVERAQGEGVGVDIWHQLVRRCPKLFWRSKPSNSINGWYFEKADGVYKTEAWYFYWLGLSEEEIRKAKDYTLNLEESFQTQAASPSMSELAVS